MDSSSESALDNLTARTSTTATPKKRSGATTKPKTWCEFSRVENPVDRVTFLQLCHDFLLDPTQLSSDIVGDRNGGSSRIVHTDHDGKAVDNFTAQEQPRLFDMERCLIPRSMIVQKRVGYLTIPIPLIQNITTSSSVSAPSSSSSATTILSSTINRATPYIAPTVLGHSSVIHCGFCNNLITLEAVTPHSSEALLHVYVHPSAPRSYIPCCASCFVDPTN